MPRPKKRSAIAKRLYAQRRSSAGVLPPLNKKGERDSKLQTTTSKPFTICDENLQSSKIPSSTHRRSLRLSNLRTPRSKAKPFSDRETSISRSEEPITSRHWNKTPNNTCDLSCEVQHASTPVTEVERQKLTEDLSAAGPEASRKQNTDARHLGKSVSGQQYLLAEPVARKDLLHLVLRLLEMVKQLHSCQMHYFYSYMTALDFSASLDLQLQTDVRTVQDLSSAQDCITQDLLTPSASPHQVDMMAIAEIVHMLVLNRPLKVSCGKSGWSLDEGSDSHHSPVDPVWKDFFQKILNPGEQSTELVLSSLINNLRDC